jgi:FlaA1/EpsC-like NDP-sugar epimerase
MNRTDRRIKNVRNRYFLLADVTSLFVAPLLAFVVRFEEVGWLAANAAIAAPYVMGGLPLKLAAFYWTGLYRRLWRHASVGELKRIMIASAAAALVSAFVGWFILPVSGVTPSRIPISVVFLDSLLTAIAITMPRLLLRIIGRSPRRRRGDGDRTALIVGAGESGKLIVKELYANPALGLVPIGFVDDDPAKYRMMMCDLPVLGQISSLKSIAADHNVAEIIIAMPSASGAVIRQVVRAALDAGVPTRTVPSIPEIISGRTRSTQLREVQIEDLLRRDPVETDLASVAALATGETVLITGAGGSIGSELCRQLGRLAPTRLVLLGHGENSIFDIYNEMRDSCRDVEIVPVIADVRDRDRMMRLLAEFEPHAVFHAAAHKHVPLMEHNVPEAVTNNVVGTRNTVDAALASGVERFVLVSTDKAVRPTSIMGATKRVAEQIVQHAAVKHGRNFVSVRFGNVLGSRGSVVPLFTRQIRSGGPVTITHPEMQRYFMTIPEAVQLVLQAGALGRGGEVFLLDMGEPIRIVDLATDLIRLSGLEPGHDIKIEFSGVRPGEKLYEEMFFSAEYVLPTEHPKVLRARNGLLADGTRRRIETLINATGRGHDESELRLMLQNLVPDFHPHGGPGRRGPTSGDHELGPLGRSPGPVSQPIEAR